MDEIKAFVKDRDDTLTAAVMQDDWDAVKRYCKKYKVPLSSNEKVMKAGIYKAAQGIIGLPQEVKDVARKKCIALGFKPMMWEG